MLRRFSRIFLSLFCASALVFLTGCESDDPRFAGDTQYLGGIYGTEPVSSSAPQDTVSYWDGDSIQGKPSVKISLGEQRAYFYKSGQLVGISQLSTGREGRNTPIGRYRIIQKDLNHASSLYGDYVDSADNVVVRTWGTPAEFDFEPRSHYELGEALGIFDFERAAKLSGARFAVLRGDGARLQRALITFFLDVATVDHGYTEIAPPYLVRRDAMVGAAQLPKFEDQAYKTDDGLFLIPTAEVPVTNLYRDEILDGADLPIAHVAFTPCWRREAGAAGKDTRGYIRLHQFDKVEMVRFTTAERSLDELELLTGHAELLLQRLGIAYRVLLMCSGDMGFAQWKKYDVEAWAPGMQRWLEVSSCSAFGDFQARRAQIRYRSAAGERPQFVHTLNGSGLGVPRAFDAMLETYQQADGSVLIPPVLQTYMGGMQRIG